MRANKRTSSNRTRDRRAQGVMLDVLDLLIPVLSGSIPVGLQIQERNEPRIARTGAWMTMLKDNAGWVVQIVRSVEQAGAVVQFYLDVKLPPV